MTSGEGRGTTSNIQYLSYGYDADNNVHTITDNVTTANNQTLTYDAIDRLKTATGSYGTISSITYRLELEPPGLRRDQLHRPLRPRQNERGRQHASPTAPPATSPASARTRMT